MGRLKANIFIIFIISVLLSIQSCSNKNNPQKNEPESPESFTFFDLGANSILSTSLREKLNKRLGSESVEGRTTIDLSIHYPKFLKKYFPELESLNKDLNWPPRERVEHNITKIMYRYAIKKGLPFTYVELFFANDSGKPLLFRIYANEKGASLMETLKDKYGPFQEIKWSDKGEKTLFWKRHQDILTASLAKNRHENTEFLYCIYYVNNINNYLKKEQKKNIADDPTIPQNNAF